MTGIDSTLVQDLIAALFCGAFIGMEREFGKSRGDATSAESAATPANPETRNLAGIRTHILFSILGAVARIVDRELKTAAWFTGLGFAVVALFVVVTYGIRAARSGHHGTTSVPTLLLTYALGVLSLTGERPLALALAVVITAVLAVKVPLHSFVRALSREELVAAVKFGLLALVLLPLLPDRAFGPRDWPWLAARLTSSGVGEATLDEFSLFNPYQLWLIVIAISGIGFVGYVLVRILGPGRGLILTGLAGGLVSSTSVTLAMSEQSRKTPSWSSSIAAAVLAACSVMTARVFVVAMALDSALFSRLLPPLGGMLVASVALAIGLARKTGSARPQGSFAPGTPLAIKPALRLAALIVLVRILSVVAILTIGDAGLLVMAALSGSVDVDPITIAASQQAAAAQVGDSVAAGAIGLAIAANTLVKGLLMLANGERKTARTTFFALLATLFVGAVGFVIVLTMHR